MSITRTLSARLFVASHQLLTRGSRRSERGDVPGWVLITLMTVAKDQLLSMFQSALSSVKG